MESGRLPSINRKKYKSLVTMSLEGLKTGVNKQLSQIDNKTKSLVVQYNELRHLK